MKCSLPPHSETLTFSTYEEFEIHYSKTHTHRCLECRRNFPTEYFLNLHIEESHDSLVAYQCFVEGCERKFSTKDKRRLHLIDYHFFPKEYDFAVVNHGVDNRSSMLRQRHRRRSSAAQQQEDKDVKSKKHSSTLETIDTKEGTADTDQAKDETTEDASGSPPTLPDADMEGLSSAMSSLKFVPRGVRFGRGRGRGRGGFSRT
ncbi:hypothetical protein BGZ60DRAFT_367902 [Tricladium varicosporioides]|nr:hypothetical protein BGZ60DRAFT_367902 [Hymenoscyphus varicosporioides]